MTSKNRHSKRSKISEAKIRQIVKLFSIDLTASQIAEITDLNRNTVNRYLTALRERIASFCHEESPVSGEVEVDESYFGARRVKGLRGRGARGKTIVFGLFKLNPTPDNALERTFGAIRDYFSVNMAIAFEEAKDNGFTTRLCLLNL